MPVPDLPPPQWHPPVAPVVVERRFRAAAPYAAGGHRGIDLRAAPAQAVRAPCSGLVTFRGAVAGGPPTVTIDCGSLRATLQRVAPSVAAGERVSAKQRVGRATAAALDLSARRPDDSYVDPAPLLDAAAPAQPPVAMAPLRRGARQRPAPTEARAQRPARLSDRALVTHQSRLAGSKEPVSAPERVDVPLGVGGVGVMVLAAACWAADVRRRRRRIAKGTGRASLARVQR